MKEAALRLNVSDGSLSNWLNFRGAFHPERSKSWSVEKREAFIVTLERETGRKLEDIFPLEKGDLEYLAKQRTHEHTVSRSQIAAIQGYSEHTAKRLEYQPPDKSMDRETIADALRESVKSLTYRERTILELRYGLVDGQTRTLKEVADILELTRERVRQVEIRAIRRLRLRGELGLDPW